MELSMRYHIMIVAISLLTGCARLSYEGAEVRITSNPDIVKGCTFLGNVKSTSGWGGSAGTGLALSNNEKTLQNDTAYLGGNVVFIVGSGIHSTGEAYRCETTPPSQK
jgi:hypothetical protein